LYRKTNQERLNNENNNKDGENNDKSNGEKAAQFMMGHAVTLQGSQDDYQHLRQSLLLDNQSTADIFCNLRYLTNIREVSETLTLHTNGGVLVCNTKGDLKGYGSVWCHPDAIANILSLSSVLEKGRYDEQFKPMMDLT
jgi:hypothetical protein